jgi:phenylacetaldehyde dehydrogenase
VTGTAFPDPQYEPRKLRLLQEHTMSDAIFSREILDRAVRFAGSEHGLLIGGKWQAAASGRTFETCNPATTAHLGMIAEAGREDVDRAVRAATDAFDKVWSKVTPAERQRLLWRLSDLVEMHADELAVLETIDNGKPVREARTMDLTNAISTLRYCAGWATRLNGETVPVSAPGDWHAYTLRQPFVVAGLIVPWNAPIMMAVSKLAPALAAGCCVILKPAELTSLTALRLGTLLQEAGFPDGAVNVLTGAGSVAGQAIVDHAGIEKISFTGSGTVGRGIIASAARTMKRVTLELGGKSAMIIMPDAELAKAIPAAARGIFGNAGQICNANSRLYVHASVYDQVLEGVTAHAESVVLGDGMAATTQMGPLVSAAQLDRVCSYVESGRADGAAVMTGGTTPNLGGHFITPTVLAQTRQEMKVVREEIFGPVVCVQRIDDTTGIDDIARLANATDYGLGAMLWTQSLGQAHRLAKLLKAGTVRINGGGLDPALPFGGFKQSGWGRESGREGVEAYTESKSVMIGL